MNWSTMWLTVFLTLASLRFRSAPGSIPRCILTAAALAGLCNTECWQLAGSTGLGFRPRLQQRAESQLPAFAVYPVAVRPALGARGLDDDIEPVAIVDLDPLVRIGLFLVGRCAAELGRGALRVACGVAAPGVTLCYPVGQCSTFGGVTRKSSAKRANHVTIWNALR